MKIRRTSRILVLLMTLILLLGVFTGCGSSESQGTDQSETNVLSWDITEYSQFRSEEQWEEHYDKHVSDQEEFVDDFGEITMEQYLMLAQWLMDFTGDDVQMKMEEDGDYLYYDAENNFFGVMSKDGYIRTFFRPSAGQDYFDRQ